MSSLKKEQERRLQTEVSGSHIQPPQHSGRRALSARRRRPLLSNQPAKRKEKLVGKLIEEADRRHLNIEYEENADDRNNLIGKGATENNTKALESEKKENEPKKKLKTDKKKKRKSASQLAVEKKPVNKNHSKRLSHRNSKANNNDQSDAEDEESDFDNDDENDEDFVASTASKRKKKGESRKRKQVKAEKATRKRAKPSGDYGTPNVRPEERKEARTNFKQTWSLIKTMRQQNVAPVDQMGCDSLADRNASPKVKRFHTLVALMLSSQTKDTATALAMTRLKKHGLTVENILKTPHSVLDNLIRNVGFHARKAEYLQKACEMLQDEYNGDIPDTLEGLLRLPGVGPKMAHLCLQCAWKKTEGIGVDVHVHRISNRLGWTKTDTSAKGPEATRAELEDWLPKEYWRPINKLLVGFGQTICTPLRPKCGGCLANQLCPTGRKALAAGHVSPKTNDK